MQSLAHALVWLDELREASPDVQALGAMRPAQALTHCAQSIEYSIAGFPSLESALLRATVGPAAAFVFATIGRTKHDTSAPIPGAPEIAATTPLEEAIDRLRRAIVAFQRHAGPLAPHFAYGQLPRARYELLHALHIDEHSRLFNPAP
jgi:hypothetical protein